MSAMFRSLSQRNYRIWFSGALASNIGTWMQRTAQDWIVLTRLSDGDATALGVVMALQFGPQLVLAPYAGVIADRFPKRRVLLVTQVLMGLLSLALGILVVTGTAQLWHVFVFAGLLGVVSSFDAPARMAFVSEIVGGDLLSNAIALNSAQFNAARLIGPAVAGVLTVAIGPGPVFLANALTFVATIAALLAMRTRDLRPSPPAKRTRGQLREGLRYVAGRPDILSVLAIAFVMSTFGLNFPVFTSTMTTAVFGTDADGFGLVSSLLAVGSLGGALLAARRERARLRVLLVACAGFAVTCGIAALAPTFWFFAIALIPVGLCSISATTTANALVQQASAPEMRGRVMALYTAIFLGGTPLGAPLMGWIAQTAGPRVSLALGGLSGVLAIAAGLAVLARSGEVRLPDAASIVRGIRRRRRPER